MVDHGERLGSRPEWPLVGGYEPPRVEQVLTATDLEREILYAGAAQADLSQDQDPG